MSKGFVFATACNSDYANEALNLVGSLQTFSNIFDCIYVYDLGLSARQRRLFAGINGLELKRVPAFTKFWRQCWSWKSWVLIDAAQGAEAVLYLDAGVEALDNLEPIKKLINEHGYFVVSQYESLDGGHNVGQIIPDDYYGIFDIPDSVKARPVIAGGLVGFKTKSAFFSHVVKPTLQYTKDGYNLGWSTQELFRNKGMHYMSNPPLRQCLWFRHDQTLLNMLFYKTIKDPILQPMDRFGGIHSRAHAEQLIWNTRKLGDLKYVGHINYSSRRVIKNLRNCLVVRAGSLVRQAVKFALRVARKLKRTLGGY